LGIIIGETAVDIRIEEHMKYIGGYVVALDMTDMSQVKPSTPWLFAKSFDTSCPVGTFIPKSEIPNPMDVDLWLKVNGKTVQEGNTRDMFYNIGELMSITSKVVTLERGDLLLTGTPPGNGPVKSGDVLEGGLANIASITFEVE